MRTVQLAVPRLDSGCPNCYFTVCEHTGIFWDIYAWAMSQLSSTLPTFFLLPLFKDRLNTAGVRTPELGVRMLSPGSPVSFPYSCPVDHSPQLSLIVFQIVVVLSYFRFSFLLTFLTFECLFFLESPPRAVFSDQLFWRSIPTCFFLILQKKMAG